MHIPSRSHLDSSIVATPSIMEMAFSGQTSMHSPEVRHFIGSTTIFMLSNLTRTGRKKLICPKALLYILFRSLNISCFRELLLNFLKKRHIIYYETKASQRSCPNRSLRNTIDSISRCSVMVSSDNGIPYSSFKGLFKGDTIFFDKVHWMI